MPSRSVEPAIRHRLPDSLREALREPFGEVLTDERQLEGVAKPIIGVGDIVSATLVRAGFRPHLIIYDGATRRGPVPDDVSRTLEAAAGHRERVANPAGTLSEELCQSVHDAFRAGISPWIIEVDGEEDLAGLPVFLEAPLGATVIYGMPTRGLVVVRVTPGVKARARDILSQMKA